MSNRRGFLKLIGMAPVAGPVAAKEAAASMGLEGALGGTVAAAIPQGMPVVESENSWLQQQIREHISGESNEEYRRSAAEDARRLDPDLAALRSVSPAWAYQTQKERAYHRQVARQDSWLKRAAKKNGLARLFGDYIK